MTTYLINQYQFADFVYSDPTNGLYINNQPDNIGFYQSGVNYILDVDAYTTAGVYTLEVYDNTDTLYDTIEITVSPVIPDIIHTGCLGEVNQFSSMLPTPPIGAWQVTGNYTPEYLTTVFNGYIVPVIDRVGDYYVLFETSIQPLLNVYLVKFEFESCFPEYDFCSRYDINIVWVNPAGGWSSYCFKGKKTYGVTTKEKKIYRDTNNVQRYYKIQDTYDTIEVLSGELPMSHVDFLKSLKYSPQAYIFRNSQFIPILIEDKDFTLYQDGDGYFFYDIKIKYAQEINIQTQ